MCNKKTGILISTLFLAFTVAQAHASSDAPALTQLPPKPDNISADLSPWLLRVRAIDVEPNAGSSTITQIGGHVSRISSQVVPELDISYFLTPNIALELILGTTRHKVKAIGTALGDVNLGRVSLLPPTLTLQYHLFMDKMIRPYVGVGANYTHFYHVNPGPTAQRIHYKDSFGPALQAGVDIALDDHWMINLDVKKIYIKSHVDVSALGTVVSTRARINPLVWGVGIGYRI